MSSATAAAKQRAQSPQVQLWQSSLGRFLPRDYDLRIVRVRGDQVLDVSRYVESIDWADETGDVGDPGGSVTMTGSMTGRRPNPLDPASLPIARGDRVMVQYRDAYDHGHPWTTEVELLVSQPEAEPKTGVVNFQVADPFVAFNSVEATFVYRKDKHHRNGWYMHQIIRDACQRVNAPVGDITLGRVAFKSPWRSDALMDHHNPHSGLLAFIMKTVGHEISKTKRQLGYWVQNGKLEVYEWGALAREALVIDTAVQELQVTTQSGGSSARPATIIRGYGRIGKGKKGKSLKVTVTAPAAIDRFGALLREVEYKNLTGAADLRDRARRTLADGLRVVRTVDVTVKGTPNLRPNDACVLAPAVSVRGDLPGYQTSFDRNEFGGPYGIAFITSRSHSVEGGVWTTQLQLAERDPWLPYRQQLAERQAAYAKKRHQSPRKH